MNSNFIYKTHKFKKDRPTFLEVSYEYQGANPVSIAIRLTSGSLLREQTIHHEPNSFYRKKPCEVPAEPNFAAYQSMTENVRNQIRKRTTKRYPTSSDSKPFHNVQPSFNTRPTINTGV